MSQRTPSTEVATIILDAGDRVLAADGLEGLTKRAIANEAGVSPQSISNRFGSLDEVEADLAVRGYERLRAAVLDHIEQPLAAIDDPVEQVIAAVRRHRAFTDRHAQLYRLMIRPGHGPRVARAADDITGLFAAVIQRAFDAGDDLPASAADHATTLLCTLTGRFVLDHAGFVTPAEPGWQLHPPGTTK